MLYHGGLLNSPGKRHPTLYEDWTPFTVAELVPHAVPPDASAELIFNQSTLPRSGAKPGNTGLCAARTAKSEAVVRHCKT